MKIKRLLTGAVAAALLGVTPVALTSAPAQATENLTTTTDVGRAYPTTKVVDYGETVGIRAAVKGSDGSNVYDGNVTLYMRLPGTDWTAVETKTAGGYVSFTDFRARRKAEYHVRYHGYTATSTYEDNYAPSTSGLLKLPVARKLNITDKTARRGVKFIGKVKPSYKRKKVVIFKKVRRKWRKYKTVRTNRRSKFSTVLPAYSRRTYWRFTINGNKQFVPTKQVWYTYRYREQARTSARVGS